MGADVAGIKIKGSAGVAATIEGTNTLLMRAVRHSTKAIREPLEREMELIHKNVRLKWPRPTKSNRGGNRRKQGKGFNPVGWASSGRSLHRWEWSTELAFKNKGAIVVCALTNPITKQGARYAFMAHMPYPNDRKFYWKELALKPAKKVSKKLITEMAERLVNKLSKG